MKRTVFIITLTLIVLAAFMYYSFYEETITVQRPGYMADKKEITENLRKTVQVLAGDIGSRGHDQFNALDRTIRYITSELREYGYTVEEQPYEYKEGAYKNIYAVKTGTKEPGRILVVGAHYDTVKGTPGADDNASAVAGMLELARLLAATPLDKTVHFVAFTLEEPPLFRSRYMGSYVYAQGLHKAGADVEGMICLEMIGFFSDGPDSQFFPLPFMRWAYPKTGNFITLVSNLQSKGFLQNVKAGFVNGTDLPVETLSTVSVVPGVDFSDHRSFWKFGYHALMVTDTAFYRNPQYHGPGDVPEILDYERMTEVVLGLKASIEQVAGKSGG